MPIDYLCYDGNPSDNVAPHRPSIDDLGSDQYEDFPSEPVDPTREWPAACCNEMCGVVASLSRMSNVVAITVHFTSGTPFVQSSAQPRTTPVVIQPLDNGVGDVSLTWPANSFPPALNDPKAYVTGATVGAASAIAISNGVRVRVKDLTNTAADLPFVVELA
jgi:hypothetical protein